MKCAEEIVGSTRAAAALKRWMRPLCNAQGRAGEDPKTLLGRESALRIPVEDRRGAGAEGEPRRQARTRTSIVELSPQCRTDSLEAIPIEAAPRGPPRLPPAATAQRPAPEAGERSSEKAEPGGRAPLPRAVATWIAAILDGPMGGTQRRAPLHARETGTPAASPIGLPVTRSSRSLFPALPESPTSSTCSPGDGVQELASERADVSILGRLRAYFWENVDAGGTGRVSKSNLFNHIRTLAEEDSEKLGTSELELLQQVVKRRFAEIDLGLSHEDQCLGVDEWVHFMMLRASAPSHVAMKLVNRQLRKALRLDKGLLARLHAAFEEADMEGTGLLHQDQWQKAFSAAGVCQPATVIDLNGDGFLDYYGFACHVLGTESHTVELALYDLSQGAAKWVPAALLGGHKFDGIWHSGVRAFGKEYWFGGALLESCPEDIPFGTPTRVLQLGTTLRTREELLEFLRNDVYVDYNPNTYDVLRRNCNHFSNELVQFLLHGRQIPEEVLMQPQWAQTTSLVRVLRPALNHWLGGFGDEASCSPTASPCSPSTPRIVSRIDDMTQEWRNRLQVGDIVLHRARFIDRPWVVRIVDLGRTRRHRTAEIVFFRPTGTRWEDVPSMLSLGGQWRWEVVRQSAVALHEFFPLLDEAEAGVQILKAGLTLNDDRFVGVLQRHPPAPFRPACPRGHRLQPLRRGAPSWFCTVPPCSVCGHPLTSSERYSCPRCNFAVCGACFSRGSSFAGGGVFADILTPELAQELLADAGWLRYRARAYFFKADHNSTGMIDKPKARRVNERLAAELRSRPLSDQELVQEMRRLSLYNKELLDPVGTSEANSDLSKSKEERKVPLVLDEESFEEFFGNALAIALDNLEEDCRSEQ